MPTLYVIAGPNGIGKTTASYDLVPVNTPLINSDEIAKEARIAGKISVNLQEYSNQEATRLVEDQLKHRNSFAIETNLADVETWKFLLHIQQTGYLIHLYFMSTDQVELLNNRISERVKLGEHFVRPDIVQQRYETGLTLLNHYFAQPDVLQLIDNSKEITLLAEIRQGNIVYLNPSQPKWTINYLHTHFTEHPKKDENRSLKNIDEVREAYRKIKRGSDER